MLFFARYCLDTTTLMEKVLIFCFIFTGKMLHFRAVFIRLDFLMPFIEFQIQDIKYWGKKLKLEKESSDILEFDFFDDIFDMI